MKPENEWVFTVDHCFQADCACEWIGPYRQTQLEARKDGEAHMKQHQIMVSRVELK